MSDDEDDDKLGNPEGDTENERPSQTLDNLSDKPCAPICRLRSGIIILLMLDSCIFVMSGSEFWLLNFQITGRKNPLGCSRKIL